MFPQVWLVCHNSYKTERQWNGVFLWITLNFVYQQGSSEHVPVNIIITISTNKQQQIKRDFLEMPLTSH